MRLTNGISRTSFIRVADEEVRRRVVDAAARKRLDLFGQMLAIGIENDDEFELPRPANDANRS